MKILLHALLKGDESLDITCCGIKYKNAYKYKENDIMVNVKNSKDTLYINRKSKEYDINLVFKKDIDTISTYKVFGGSKEFSLNTKTKKIKISDNKIELEYELEGDKYNYLLEVVHEGEIN